MFCNVSPLFLSSLVCLYFSLLYHHALPSLPCSVSIRLTLVLPCFRSPSCLFHRALQRLRINKLYISLCTRSKAPFRKGTELVCSWACVYPKWLHQTWSRVSGSPNCPRSFVMPQTQFSYSPRSPCWYSSLAPILGLYTASRQRQYVAVNSKGTIV